MLASVEDAPLSSDAFVYEPKYDGIRAIVAVEPARGGPLVRFWSRLGNEKTHQFPEVAEAVREWAHATKRPLVIDGEIVALDAHGQPRGFQHLQGRMHLREPGPHRARAAGTALIAFDVLRDGDEDLRGLPLHARRARLERLFARNPHGQVRISEQAVGDGRDMHARAQAEGWEGLIAKRVDSAYRSGKRSPDWRKLKLIRTQSAVIGGWTEPRGARAHLGALLLGVFDDDGRLRYIGHAGSGFSGAELERVWKRLRALEIPSSPFAVPPPTNERPHWVRPSLVAEVKFTEWTNDGVLRHPTYLGLRDDVEASSVHQEPDAAERPIARRNAGRTRRDQPGPGRPEPPAKSPAGRVSKRPAGARKTGRSVPDPFSSRTDSRPGKTGDLIDALDEIQARGGSGVLALPGGDRLDVTNLGKVFWPRPRLTKGDLFRHYVRVAPYLLPILADRPLVMKRYPNGVDGQAFYQHRAPDPLPSGIRVEKVKESGTTREHLIGGTLKTLLYTAQLAALSQDPWFSRMGSLDAVDFVALDLDPPDGAPFSRVCDVARRVRDELDALGAPAFAKTSGASGLHVYVPLAPGTPYEAGLLFCQLVATTVAHKHPKAATVERSVRARGGRVYVDYLQNIGGKTLASAYSARASRFAGVSAPVTWDEVASGVSPEDFTISTFAARLDAVGDLWAAMRKAKGVDLRAMTKRRRSKT